MDSDDGSGDLSGSANIQSVPDLSGEVSITEFAYLTRGRYSFIYKGSYHGEIVSDALYSLLHSLTNPKVAVKVLNVVAKNEDSMRRVFPSSFHKLCVKFHAETQSPTRRLGEFESPQYSLRIHPRRWNFWSIWFSYFSSRLCYIVITWLTSYIVVPQWECRRLSSNQGQ
jgi:hypothetical protein